jgi:hypothetical protein
MMKRRVNLTIDAGVLGRARREARRRRTSVSRLVENLLDEAASEDESEDFIEKWEAGLKLAPPDPEEPRRVRLWKKYGLVGDADTH